MVGDNIKSLRKIHDLIRPYFVRIVEISCSSLRRYENGMSYVLTELIDRICQKFNISCGDIVGEEKTLTTSRRLSIDIENRSHQRAWRSYFI